MPIDHFGPVVPHAQLQPLVTFLIASLQHMGFKEMRRHGDFVVGLGEEGATPYLWIAGVPIQGLEDDAREKYLQAGHTAFAAKSVEDVKAFHAAAMAAGAQDDGAPGPRPWFAPGYYAAFVRDPVIGMKWEVVFRDYKE